MTPSPLFTPQNVELWDITIAIGVTGVYGPVMAIASQFKGLNQPLEAYSIRLSEA